MISKSILLPLLLVQALVIAAASPIPDPLFGIGGPPLPPPPPPLGRLGGPPLPPPLGRLGGTPLLPPPPGSFGGLVGLPGGLPPVGLPPPRIGLLNRPVPGLPF